MSDMHRPTNLEAGSSRFGDLEDDESFSSPFDIPTTKSASIERLKRWRQAALVLNASRRFRYTLDLKKEEEKRQTLRKIREHARAIRAAYLFQAGDQMNGAAKPPPTPSGDFGIGQDQLASITRDHDFRTLQQYGGVKGIADLLKANLEKGINGGDDDLLKRRNAFGVFGCFFGELGRILL
nr:calcium-transporting ATPase 10, plasma membrane-type-like [Ziziphus jujuba var. spinosa]XP_048319373.1 calcium-transporting ATPase 10, plasma membrane-type-like [Ziziphus jujuba var. spinosa]XP_048319376.1 calcium-transporting ATPase 10, plasma membrane-type-like [Ziziphus jujuba var. spinosa]XP_048319379.1 calcium-transporting ATPase 10, plasma membrane-type-like [Ziziphus jujuba var. spinosa]